VLDRGGRRDVAVQVARLLHVTLSSSWTRSLCSDHSSATKALVEFTPIGRPIFSPTTRALVEFTPIGPPSSAGIGYTIASRTNSRL
jgi:hypothetical protein